MDNSITIGIKWLMETIEEKWNELEERVARDVKTKQEKDQQNKEERAERVRKSIELRLNKILLYVFSKFSFNLFHFFCHLKFVIQ